MDEHGIDPEVIKPETLENINNVLEDPKIDFVFICTPTSTHTQMTRLALEKGKHVLCEKPLAENPEEIGECYDLAEKMGKQLLCGFMRRFDPTLKTLIDEVQKGKVGDIHTIRTIMRDCPGAPLQFIKDCGAQGKGAAIFEDLGTHDVTIVLALLGGDKAVSVFSMGSAFDPELKAINCPEISLSMIKFESGATATIDLGYRSKYGYDVRTEVSGSLGVMQANNVIDTGVTSITLEGETSDPPIWSYPERFGPAYAAEVDHIVDCIQGKAKMAFGKEHAMDVCRVVDAMKESYLQGKPVKV